MAEPETNVARERSAFVGRESELARLASSFDDARTRVVVVLGPSGVGKTRLAGELALARVSAYPGGTWMCALGEAATEGDLTRITARVLGVDTVSAEPFEALLARRFAVRGRTLLVLDNADRLGGDAAAMRAIASWSAAAPVLDILVTSTRALDLPASSWELEPLATESTGATAPAVRLFLDRVREVTGTPLEEAEVAASVARIVRELDGLPLAIELAAGCMQTLGTVDLEFLLQHRRLDLLQRDGRSVGSGIDASWGLLAAQEQRALAWLSVFRGGFELSAATRLPDLGSGDDPTPVVDALEILVKRSLVHVVAQDPRQPRRFDLYESIARFAEAKLGARGEEARAVASHAEYFGQVASLSFEQCWGPRSIETLDALAREEENLHAVVRRWRASPDDERVNAVTDVLAALGLLYVQRGPLAAFAELYQSVQAEHDRRARHANPIARARLRWMRVLARRSGGRLEGYVELLDEAVAYAADASARWVHGHLLVERARYSLGRGEIAAARRALEAALAIAHALDDAAVESAVEHVSAEIAVLTDDVLGAMDHSQRCIALAEQSRDPQLQANAALMHGSVLAAQRRPSEALVEILKTIEICRAARSVKGEAYGLLLAGIIELELERHDAALGHLGQALASGEQKGELRIVAWARAYRGLLHHDCGRFAEAIAEYEAALPSLVALRETSAMPLFLAAQGAAESALGRSSLAAARMERARAAATSLALDVISAAVDAFGAVLDARHARELLDVDAVSAAASMDQAKRTLERVTRAAPDGKATSAADRSADVRIAVRIAERDIGSLADRPAVVLVAHDGSWFQAPAGERVALQKTRLLRNLLARLVAAHELDPHAVLRRVDVVAALWPGEVMSDRSADNRVFVAVSKLRQLGLKNILLSVDDGWQLDPGIRVERAPSAPSRPPPGRS